MIQQEFQARAEPLDMWRFLLDNFFLFGRSKEGIARAKDEVASNDVCNRGGSGGHVGTGAREGSLGKGVYIGNSGMVPVPPYYHSNRGSVSQERHTHVTRNPVQEFA